MSRKEHSDRNDLVGEHRFGDVGQIILFCVFMIVWVADSYIVNYTIYPAELVSPIIRIPLGIALIAASSYLVKASHEVIFEEIRDNPSVVRKGVYSRVRHPMYSGCLGMYLGLVIVTFSIAATVVWSLIASFYYYISRYEEKLLLSKLEKITNNICVKCLCGYRWQSQERTR